MTNFAILKITLFFDPAQTWQHFDQFNKDFADFLATKGLEAQTVKAVGGAISEDILLISKKEVLKLPEQTDKQVGPQKALAALSKPESAKAQQFKQGKFLSRKGYLKKE